jgi:Zn-dependent protease with chaperone function
MQINVLCPKCNTSLKIPETLAGKRGRCPKCQATLNVPEIKDWPKSVQASEQKIIASSNIAVPPQADTACDATPPNKASEPKLDYGAGQSISLVDAFVGEIEPVPKSLAYILSIPLITLFMILLPLAYVALIAATGFLVYYHAVNDMGMLSYGQGRGVFMVFIAYLAPIVSGVILIFFMIKPLFARPMREARTRSLTKQGEPILFAVVERLCELIGAPKPTRIDVDYCLNASAHFRRGFLSMLGSDLVLTIGMPLASGLSLRQLVGVLAHEFGHFSQGMGMRLSYIIRSINAWFARVVYERDAWDAWLANTASKIDLRIGWVLFLSMIFVWMSRRILWALMILGHAASGLLLRQMEYDADRYEARTVGADTFEATTKRIQTLAAAYQMAQMKIVEFYKKGEYPDDLSRLMTIMHGRMPIEMLHEIECVSDKNKTGFFNTHPCDKDRIANVRREGLPGVFQAEGPVNLLFCHFEALTRNVTWDLYCELIGPHIKPSDIKPVEQLLD